MRIDGGPLCRYLQIFRILCVLVNSFFFWSRQFKKRVEQDKRMGEDTKWKLLVRRVVSAKAMSSLCQSSKKNKYDGEAEGLVRNRTGMRWGL